MKTFKPKQSRSALVNRLAGLVLGLSLGAIAINENTLVGIVITLMVVMLVVFMTKNESKIVTKDSEIIFVNVDGAPKGSVPWERVKKIEKEWEIGFQFHPRGHVTGNTPHWKYNIETDSGDPIVFYDNFGEGLEQQLECLCNFKGIPFDVKPII